MGSTNESGLAPGQEWELKFQLARKQLPELPRALKAMGLTVGAPETKHLVATYYDTPAFDLRGRGAILRVRREGERLVQCVKARVSSGQCSALRNEWESDVPVSSPDPSLVPDAALACLGDGIDWGGLRPVFCVDVERTARLIRLDEASVVELCVDVGQIATDGSSCPVCEYELELKAGDPLGLFSIAQRLVGVVPARLDARTKADRGYSLAGEEGNGWHRATPVKLAGAQTAEDAFVQVIRSGLSQLRLNEECVLVRAHPEGVHQMRVAVRRMRSAFGIYRQLLPPCERDGLAGELKWLLRALGPSRDWDVFFAETLGTVLAARPGDAALRLMEKRADAERTAAYHAAREALCSQRYTVLLLRLEAWLLARGWREQKVSAQSARLFSPAASLAASVLTRRAKRLRKAGKHFGTLSPEQRHRVRIHVKKLRYASEFFRSLWPKGKTERYIRSLESLQDVLGRLNDRAVARGLIGQLVRGADAEEGAQLSLAAGMIIGWHARDAGSGDGTEQWRAFRAGEPFWGRG